MRKLYAENTANYPRLKTDKFFADYENEFNYNGCVDESMTFAENAQLLRTDLWERFVAQYKADSDGADAGWRGEYWGKMMRGASFVYSYTKNPKLYEILVNTVEEMIKTADENGRISSYAVEREFDGWDIWSRKYVLLGMQYFMEICEDNGLKARIIESMTKQIDYIISKIGKKEDGKKPITSATRHWRGLNSSSLLEPIIRMYAITGEKRFFDFATYIVEAGGADVVNIFELAYKNQMSPYQYPVTKAYEMTSCFEGLLEYYRITGEEKYKTAILNFADKILENDFTVIGCSGCTSEYFDHSTVRQANTTNEKIMQETCVTVTIMKFMYQLNLLTGNSKYADAFEISFYNAYLGSLNTENVIGRSELHDMYSDLNIEPLPYDSYSPLTAGTRGNEVGGAKVMADKYYYGCCACIGSAGSGLVPKMHILSTENGFAMNMYIDGTVKTTAPDGSKIAIVTSTAYPKCGNVKITVETEKDIEFELKLRNPYWSKNTSVTADNAKTVMGNGYISVIKKWSDGDSVEIDLDMRTEAIRPIPYGSQIIVNKPIWSYNYMIPTYDEEDPLAKYHVALRRGPIMLAQDSRLGYDLDTPIEVAIDDDGYVDTVIPKEDTVEYAHIIEADVPLTDGTSIKLTDYSSAGKLWNEKSTMAVWLLTK